jgi:hypothetical protein
MYRDSYCDISISRSGTGTVGVLGRREAFGAAGAIVLVCGCMHTLVRMKLVE